MTAKDIVTPYAGVWIETLKPEAPPNTLVSLPMRECGLKRVSTDEQADKGRSLPMRECGLKLDDVPGERRRPASLPMRECGLKPAMKQRTAEVLSHSLCGSVD